MESLKQLKALSASPRRADAKAREASEGIQFETRGKRAPVRTGPPIDLDALAVSQPGFAPLFQRS